MERDRSRIDRLHRERAEGMATGRKKKKKGRLFGNPLILFAGLGVMALIFAILGRTGFWGHGGESDTARYAVYGGRVYYEYDAPVIRDSLMFLGNLGASADGDKTADFYTHGFDFGSLYTIEGYESDTWLAVYYGGEYFALRTERTNE
jgi:hypothetical protein